MINEELTQQECNLASRVGDMTMQEIRKAIDKLLAKLEEWQKGNAATKSQKMPEIKHGNMTLKQLQQQSGGGLATVELKDPHLRTLKDTLKKHGVDFSAVKDGKGQYTLFFKGKDVDTVTHDFKQYTQKLVKMEKSAVIAKPSIAAALTAAKELAKSLNAGKDKEKTKSRGAR